MSADESVNEGRFKYIEYQLQLIMSRALAALRALVATSNHASTSNGGTVGPATTVLFQQAASSFKPTVSGKCIVSALIGGTGTSTNTITCRLTFNGTPFGPTVVTDVDAEGNFAAAITPVIDSEGAVGTFLQYGIQAVSSAAAVTIPAGRAAIFVQELPA
jgi:hypothetical protein